MAAGTCPGATAALDAPVEAAAIADTGGGAAVLPDAVSGWRQAASADNASAAAIS